MFVVLNILFISLYVMYTACTTALLFDVCLTNRPTLLLLGVTYCVKIYTSDIVPFESVLEKKFQC